jgi:hypothetical protein
MATVLDLHCGVVNKDLTLPDQTAGYPNYHGCFEPSAVHTPGQGLERSMQVRTIVAKEKRMKSETNFRLVYFCTFLLPTFDNIYSILYAF